MKLAGIVTLLGFSATASSQARTLSVSYDAGYDQAGRSMNVVACSDGVNGLVTRMSAVFTFISGILTVARLRMNNPRTDPTLPSHRR